MPDGAGGWVDGLLTNTPTNIPDPVMVVEMMSYEVNQRNVIRVAYTSSLDLPANGSVELALHTDNQGFNLNLGLNDSGGVPLTSGVT